ncbi:MAG: hypothetical protein ACTHZ5_13170 [Micrococcaceae bacterium]
MKVATIAVLGSLICLTVVACAQGNQTTSGASSSSQRDSASSNSSGRFQLMETQSDLENLRSVQWDDWELHETDTIRLYFVAEPRECYAVMPTVEMTQESVIVNLQVGTIPGAGECTADLKESAVDITLDQELGSRSVVSSSR